MKREHDELHIIYGLWTFYASSITLKGESWSGVGLNASDIYKVYCLILLSLVMSFFTYNNRRDVFIDFVYLTTSMTIA